MRNDAAYSLLTDKEQLAVTSFVAKLNHEIGARIQTVALFGSKARGASSPDSDIDILIVVDQESWALRRIISGWAAESSLEHDVLIEPRVFGSERWKKMARQKFSFYQNIAQDRVVLQT